VLWPASPSAGRVYVYEPGNHEIEIRHWKNVAEAGCHCSINELKAIYNGKIPGKEFISKDCILSLYRVCHEAQTEVESEARDKRFTEKQRSSGSADEDMANTDDHGSSAGSAKKMKYLA
jgi:hypothetical protein